MYTGVIEGSAPAIVLDRGQDPSVCCQASHQIFLEPEGLTTNEFYPNGLDESALRRTDRAGVRSIRGLEQPTFYGRVTPSSTTTTIHATKVVAGTNRSRACLCGTDNGTTGYEEAAAQGILAGINAALFIRDEHAWCPRRDEGYIGVLVDDLIYPRCLEPYRMFTSRAEYRLTCARTTRTSDSRAGRRLGVVDDVPGTRSRPQA